MTSVSPISTTARNINALSTQTRLGNRPQITQGNLRFSGDAFQIRQELKQEAEAARVAAESTKAQVAKQAAGSSTETKRRRF
jgi:hypothetical protein